jgi:TRAP-type C4-dicarboxylate transport system permease small subunit
MADLTSHTADPENSRSLLGRVDRWLSPVEDAFNLVSAAAIFGLMLLGVSQIILRSKLFNAPMFGYIDLVELSMASFAFLGVAYCQRLSGHVRMEFVVSHVSGRTLWIAEILGTLVALAIVSVLGWFGWEHALRAYELGDSTIDAEYPVWPSKLLVPIAFAVLWLRLLVQLAGFVRLAIDPRAKPVAVPVVHDVAEMARAEIRDALGEDADKGDFPR